MRTTGLRGVRIHGSTYPIRNGPTHASDHGNTTSVAEANHLLRHRLRGHEHTRHINIKHGVAVLG